MCCTPTCVSSTLIAVDHVAKREEGRLMSALGQCENPNVLRHVWTPINESHFDFFGDIPSVPKFLQGLRLKLPILVHLCVLPLLQLPRDLRGVLGISIRQAPLVRITGASRPRSHERLLECPLAFVSTAEQIYNMGHRCAASDGLYCLPGM